MNRLASLSIVFFASSVLSASALADTGVINLGPEEILQAQGKEIVVPGYSVPSFEDWNNDGRKDLIVGEGGGGAIGKIRVYLNVGTEADPCFTDYFYAKSKGQDLTITPEGCLGCFPRLVPWSGEGHKDLLVGLGGGTVRVFLNIGSDNEPSFDGGTTLVVGPTYSDALDIGSRATPDLVDWNNDGWADVVAGGLDGGIHVYINCGCGGGYIPPRFATSPDGGWIVQADDSPLSVWSGRSSPVIHDADGDGKKDIITGNTDGQIFFYKNIGTDSLPLFGGYTMVQSSGALIDLVGTLRTRPSACYWTGSKDAYWDLLVGYGDGKIRLYRGLPKAGDFDSNGTLDAADFTIMAKALDKPLPVGGSPCDLNLDGVVDNRDLRLFADQWLAEREAQEN